MALLDFLNVGANPGGLFGNLGNGQVGNALGNFGQGLTNWLQSNPNEVYALASGLTSAPNLRSGISNAAGMMPQARQADIAYQGQKAAQNFFKNPENTRAMNPALLSLLQSDPTLAQSYLANTVTARPTFQQIGIDPYTGAAQYGWVDAASGTVTPVSSSTSSTGYGAANGGDVNSPSAPTNAASGTTASGANNTPPLSTADMGTIPGPGSVFSALPSNLQQMAVKLAKGQVPYQTPRQMGMTPQMYSNLIDAANEWTISNGDPSGFTAQKWPTMLSTQQQFTSGSAAQTITAGNTAIGHLGKLVSWIDKLPQGMFGNVPFVGYATRAVNDASVRGTPQGAALASFEAERKAVSDELTKFYRGTGGSEADVQGALANFDAAKSPAELHAAAAALVDLIQSKVGALQNQWHNGMGNAVPDRPIITPEAQSTIDQILQGANNPASPQPQSFTEGMTASGPNGQRIVFHNGQWLDATTGRVVQ